MNAEETGSSNMIHIFTKSLLFFSILYTQLLHFANFTLKFSTAFSYCLQNRSTKQWRSS